MASVRTLPTIARGLRRTSDHSVAEPPDEFGVSAVGLVQLGFERLGGLAGNDRLELLNTGSPDSVNRAEVLQQKATSGRSDALYGVELGGEAQL